MRRPCYGCQTPISDEPGNYYCPACVADQLREQGDEREAFDAFHAYADACARRCERDTCGSCGQQVLGERDPGGRFRCYHCAETARTAPPVTALRLFEPAPEQMPGQTWIETP